jgi:hypothetical protein
LHLRAKLNAAWARCYSCRADPRFSQNAPPRLDDPLSVSIAGTTGVPVQQPGDDLHRLRLVDRI